MIRIVGTEKDIGRLLRNLEQIYDLRLYPSIPEPDRQYGQYRSYVDIPIEEES